MVDYRRLLRKVIRGFVFCFACGGLVQIGERRSDEFLQTSLVPVSKAPADRVLVAVFLRRIAPAALVMLVAGCSATSGFLPSAGPLAVQVSAQQEAARLPVQVIELDDTTARRVMATQRRRRFHEIFGPGGGTAYAVGPGDTVEVSIWEAPPATLFSTAAFDSRAGMTASRAVTFPEQMVSANGTINIPFAGSVPVTGKSPRQIETEIANRLEGMANQPQVLARVTHNATSEVTVMGELKQNARMPLTAKGERLLDALAAAGGADRPVEKTTIQITRGGRVAAMPLIEIIRDPRQNIHLRSGDVVTALFQSNSFTALGASGRNEEIDFEAQGITLAQALGRIGGLQDMRADARGVFVFRFEEPAALRSGGEGLPRTPDGEVPVVYRADLNNPATFLVAQNFPVRDGDVIYVANAPAVELQKFLNILASTVYTAVLTRAAIQ